MIRALAKKLLPVSFRPTSILKRWMDNRTKGGAVVAFGPFQELKMGPESFFSSIYSKLMGVYEQELHEKIEVIISLAPSMIVDIGAAEGYYACGFAYRLREKTRIIAYEADVISRYILKRNIRRNSLDAYVEVRGACAVADVETCLSENARPIVIFCDAEGWEHELLDMESVPDLRRAYILVELHDFYLRDIGDVLKERFSGTHLVSEVHSRVRTFQDLGVVSKNKAFRFLPKSTIEHFFRERPGAQTWLFLEPRGENHDSS